MEYDPELARKGAVALVMDAFFSGKIKSPQAESED